MENIVVSFRGTSVRVLVGRACLQWTGDDIPGMLASTKYPDQLIYRDLKEKLYYEVIEYFNKGKACNTYKVYRFVSVESFCQFSIKS